MSLKKPSQPPEPETPAPAPNWLRPHGPRWSVSSQARVLDNSWFAIDAYRAAAPTGVDTDYYVIQKKALAVWVIPLHDDGTVTLVGQWRFPFGAYSWELPEGGVPFAEDPLAGAKRELSEEAGLQASQWREILRLDLSNASSDERCIGYLATALSLSNEHAADDTEDLAVARVPFREALGAATAGHIQDAITVALLLRLHHMAVTGVLHPALAAAVLG